MARNAKNTRMCAGCMQRRDKTDFMCIKRLKSGEVFIAEEGRYEGRGVYICHDEKCLDKAIKRKALNRSFRCDIPANLYDNIRNSLKQE